MTTDNSENKLPPQPSNTQATPVTGDGSTLSLDEEVMDIAEMEPEGAPADDFEANARLGADDDNDIISDENPSLGPPDEQFDEIENPDKGDDD